MVVIGTDVHKSTHTFVAVDEVGRQLGCKVVKAVSAGHGEAIMWAREHFGTDLTWGIEDCRNMSVRLERDLLTAGQTVVRVPTKLMDRERKATRTRGKSDPIDAFAVARAVLREPDLPAATHDEVSRELKLLTDRRDIVVRQRTAAINRLRWLVHELDPERAPGPRKLGAAKHHKALQAWLVTVTGIVAEMARAELADVIRLTEESKKLAARIGVRIRQVAPSLLSLFGCAELTAARIVGETAGVSRFKGEAAFANHAGAAPIPVWSGNTHGQHRLNRSGNRQLNRALHDIARTQIAHPSLGQTYYHAKSQEKKTPKAAMRCLKRHLARVVYRHLIADQQTRQSAPQTAAA